MEIPDALQCLFSAEIDSTDGSYTVEVPRQELQLGALEDGETYRVAILARATEADAERQESTQTTQSSPSTHTAPVSEGETREVEIEDIGVQGDGIARVERGFVVIVPDTELNERVTIEITNVGENVAFAEVLDRQTHIQ